MKRKRVKNSVFKLFVIIRIKHLWYTLLTSSLRFKCSIIAIVNVCETHWTLQQMAWRKPIILPPLVSASSCGELQLSLPHLLCTSFSLFFSASILPFSILSVISPSLSTQRTLFCGTVFAYLKAPRFIFA